NREVKRHLYALLHDIVEKPDWHLTLPIIQNIINHTKHSATGYSPTDMLFGLRTKSLLAKDWTEAREKSKEELPKAHKDVDVYVKFLTDNIKQIHAAAAARQKKDELAKEIPEIVKDTYVLIRRIPAPVKFQFPWEGPSNLP
ncbi:hypothetical protein ADUPG1_005505, partial [Aduncisulcus paluster]